MNTIHAIKTPPRLVDAALVPAVLIGVQLGARRVRAASEALGVSAALN